MAAQSERVGSLPNLQESDQVELIMQEMCRRMVIDVVKDHPLDRQTDISERRRSIFETLYTRIPAYGPLWKRWIMENTDLFHAIIIKVTDRETIEFMQRHAKTRTPSTTGRRMPDKGTMASPVSKMSLSETPRTEDLRRLVQLSLKNDVVESDDYNFLTKLKAMDLNGKQEEMVDHLLRKKITSLLVGTESTSLDSANVFHTRGLLEMAFESPQPDALRDILRQAAMSYFASHARDKIDRFTNAILGTAALASSEHTEMFQMFADSGLSKEVIQHIRAFVHIGYVSMVMEGILTILRKELQTITPGRASYDHQLDGIVERTRGMGIVRLIPPSSGPAQQGAAGSSFKTIREQLAGLDCEYVFDHVVSLLRRPIGTSSDMGCFGMRWKRDKGKANASGMATTPRRLAQALVHDEETDTLVLRSRHSLQDIYTLSNMSVVTMDDGRVYVPQRPTYRKQTARKRPLNEFDHSYRVVKRIEEALGVANKQFAACAKHANDMADELLGEERKRERSDLEERIRFTIAASPDASPNVTPENSPIASLATPVNVDDRKRLAETIINHLFFRADKKQVVFDPTREANIPLQPDLNTVYIVPYGSFLYSEYAGDLDVYYHSNHPIEERHLLSEGTLVEEVRDMGGGKVHYVVNHLGVPLDIHVGHKLEDIRRTLGIHAIVEAEMASNHLSQTYDRLKGFCKERGYYGSHYKLLSGMTAAMLCIAATRPPWRWMKGIHPTYCTGPSGSKTAHGFR